MSAWAASGEPPHRRRQRGRGGRSVDRPTQDRLAALATAPEVETFPTGHGHNVVEYGGALRRYRGTIPRINPVVLLDVERAQRQLNHLSRSVRWTPPGRRQRGDLDGQSAATWMRRTSPRRAAGRCSSSVRGRRGGSARECRSCTCSLHPFGRRRRDPLRHRGRRPAGPLRGRVASIPCGWPRGSGRSGSSLARPRGGSSTRPTG